MGDSSFYSTLYVYKNIIFKDQCDASKKVTKVHELYAMALVQCIRIEKRTKVAVQISHKHFSCTPRKSADNDQLGEGLRPVNNFVMYI